MPQTRLPRKEFLARRAHQSILGTSIKGMLANKILGHDPSEVERRGVIGTSVHTVARAILGFGGQRGGISDRIVPTREKGESQAQKIPRMVLGRELAPLIRDNTKAVRGLEIMLKSILSESVIIRKIVEGRIKFDPRHGHRGGSRYTAVGESGNVKLGTKIRHGDFLSKFTLLDPAHRKKAPVKKDEEEFNENLERDTQIKEVAKASFESSGTDEMSPEALEEKETPSASGGGSGGFGGILAALAGAGVLKLGKGKAATKVGSIAARKGLTTAAKHGIMKGAGKSLLKKLPIISVAAGLTFGARRAMAGDYLGAAGEVASGIAGSVPGIGTGVSLAIDGGLIARDIKQASVESVPKELIDELAVPETGDGNTVINSVVPITNTDVSGSPAPVGMETDVRTTVNSFLRHQDLRFVRSF